MVEEMFQLIPGEAKGEISQGQPALLEEQCERAKCGYHGGHRGREVRLSSSPW